MKNLCKAFFIMVAVCGLLAGSPADAAHKSAKHAAPAKTADAGDESLYIKRGTTGVLALENLHENGSTCLTCTNGIYGTSGTHNMRSNEY